MATVNASAFQERDESPKRPFRRKNPSISPIQRSVVLRPALTRATGTHTDLLEKTKMPTGVVKWYNPTKGFGFIQPEDGGKDVFVHVSAVERAGHGDPQEGDRISYDLEKGRDGRESATGLRAPDA
jgi:CspA family cold shock protein